MLKKMIIFCLLLTIFSLSFGNIVIENKALEVAENFYYYKNDFRNSNFAYSDVNLQSYNNEDTFYAIKLVPQGFILISANDLIMPILGYSFENNFESENIPSNINYLFNLYSKELVESKKTNRVNTYITSQWNFFNQPIEYEGQNRNVSPLISARFNQDSPWNDMCPEDSDGPGGNVYVGCVAVSMAQIMHYWSYPEVGYGSHGYNHWEYGYQSANFGNAIYNYDDMPNNYATSETQELLYHCGVAVNMGYGDDGSGANVFGNGNTTERAMKDYFLFKDDLYDIHPGNYSTSQYREILQNELDNNRPMIYVGYSNEGGHAWNIDGYDGDHFHNNWGWGGSQNGYFLLSSLNSFDYDQGALINMEPQSLNNPNVVLNDFYYQEESGDGDLVANPGESINLYVTVENLIPWSNSSSSDLILTTDDPQLNIINDYVIIDYLSSGSTYTNNNNPFVIEFPEDISLTSHQLILNIVSTGTSGESDFNTFYIDVAVSIQQSGFPYALTLSNEEVVTVIDSSPKIIDINDDSYPEIFFGDKNGFVHGIDYNGNPINGFPVELEGVSNEIWGSPAIGDIDNDNEIEIVIVSKNNHAYIIDQNGNIELDYETDEFLMGSPSLANIDDDDNLEIVFVGYTPSGKIYAINHDGTNVQNFPVSINEKILRGAAIYDVNQNGKDDIIVATENEKMVSIVYDDGTLNTIFNSNDKFKSAPSIIDQNGNIIIVVGNEGGHFYGLTVDGDIIFDVETNDNIRSEAGFIEINNQLAIFFGSEDGHLYAIDINGNNITNWPQYIGNVNINSSPVFADVDNDGDAEVISATEQGHLLIYHLDGIPYSNYPLQLDVGFNSSPTVADIDNDNDLEIIIGTNQNLSIYDIKENTTEEQYYWYTYRGDLSNSGSYIYSNSSNIGDLNFDGLINIQDLVITINIIIGIINPTQNQIIAADINYDGTLDVLDVVLLVNIILD